MMDKVYMESQVTARDLYSRILLALTLLDDCESVGSVLIGRNGPIQRMSREDEGYIYFADNFSPPARERFEKIRSKAKRIYAFCDESTALNNESLYLRRRASSESMELCDAIFATSKYHADLLSRGYPAFGGRIEPLGLPRFDLLGKQYRSIYETQIAQIREKYGKYTLVASNGVRANHIRIDDVIRKILDRGDLKQSEVEEFRAFYDNINAAAADFDEAAIEIAANNPGMTFVYRGKPSAEYALSRSRAVPDNMHVDSTFSVHPWAIAADSLVHQNCTTGIEAYAAGTTAIDFLPPELEFISQAPKAVSRIVADRDELEARILQSARGETVGRASDGDVEYFSGLNEETASSRIATYVAKDLAGGDVSRSGDRPGGEPLSLRGRLWSTSLFRRYFDQRNRRGRGGDIRYGDVMLCIAELRKATKHLAADRRLAIRWQEKELFEISRSRGNG